MRVLVGGCFNKIHFGHVYFLSRARAGGNSLSVVLTHDRNNRKKNKISAKKRIHNLSKLHIADQILIGDAKDFRKPIEAASPDQVCLGYDQIISVKLRTLLEERDIKTRRIEKLPGYKKTANKLTGRIVSGLSQAAGFMEMSEYKRRISALMKQDFFPGTLNVEMCVNDFGRYLKSTKMFRMDPFTHSGKSYGGLKLWPAELLVYKFKDGVPALPLENNMKREKVWVLVPDRTRHMDATAEIIHEKHLRSHCRLKDNDLVELVL